MKIGVSFTCFNGTELLRKAVEEIKPLADVLHLSYQRTSNRGEDIEPEDMENISAINCHKSEYFPDLTLNTKENERRKHMSMISYLRDQDCTHFLLMACDEFYLPTDIMSRTHMARQVDITYTGMFTYYKNPTWQLTPPEDYYKPFICKIYPATEITPENRYPILVDPSVRVKPASTFKEMPFKMHHYSMIRKDIKSKFRNAASSVNWTEEKVKRFIDEYENYDLEKNPGVEYFGGRKIKVVPNYFGL